MILMPCLWDVNVPIGMWVCRIRRERNSAAMASNVTIAPRCLHGRRYAKLVGNKIWPPHTVVLLFLTVGRQCAAMASKILVAKRKLHPSGYNLLHFSQALHAMDFLQYILPQQEYRLHILSPDRKNPPAIICL